MLKRIICSVIVVFILFGATGCSGSEDPYTISRKMLHDIQKYLQEENAEEFCNLFSLDSDVTIQEVKDLFSYIGEIDSFGKGGGISPGGATKINGKYIEYSYGGKFTITSKDGIEYKVVFSAAAINTENPGDVGLYRIGFNNLADPDDVYGVGAYYNEKGEELDLKGKVVNRPKRKISQ